MDASMLFESAFFYNETFVTQGVSVDSEYRKYSRGTQQSLLAWNGDQIDLGLVRL